jgi:large subunit ribosomal protein L22
MEVIAKNSLRISTRKIRLIADSIRNLPIDRAIDALSVIEKRGALDLKKVMLSAVANAVNNSKLDRDNLKIKAIEISETPSLKRFRPSTRGRVHKYKKRGSNIKIILEEVKVSGS